MNKKVLLEFIQRILESCSERKAMHSLEELKNILERQQVSEDMILLVEKAKRSVPEAKAAAKEKPVSEQDIETAYTRAEARRQREAAARAYGRC